MDSKVRDITLQYLDGYSVCDYCIGSLQKISKPPLDLIEEMLISAYGLDKVILTFGAREAIGLVMRGVVGHGDYVIVDQNRHYSSILAVESVGAEFIEALTTGYPEYVVGADAYKDAIEEGKKKYGKLPALILLTHVDGRWGNVTDAKAVGDVAKQHGVPFLLNSAYSAGRFGFSADKLGADFVAISGHKSFGSSGPIGALLFRSEWSEQLLHESKFYPGKYVETLGCTVRGTAAVSFLEALKILSERLGRWGQEVQRTRDFVSDMEELGCGWDGRGNEIIQSGIKQLGETPKNHDLMYFETPIFDEIAQKHRKKGYFLAEELKKRGVMGVQPGKTKGIKMSIYGLNDEEIKQVINSFKEIINAG